MSVTSLFLGLVGALLVCGLFLLARATYRFMKGLGTKREIAHAAFMVATYAVFAAVVFFLLKG